ncbi:MAG: hypothetical protein ACRCW8_03225, partial [Cetobacterium sp.]
IIFSEFLNNNKEHIKEEYRSEIEKIRTMLSSSLTTLLLYLITQTGIEVVDEDSYKRMVEKYATIDITREIEMFYNLFLKSMLN